MDTTITYRGYIGLHGGYFGIMENRMETTIIYRVILGLYWDNGKDNGTYHSGFRV